MRESLGLVPPGTMPSDWLPTVGQIRWFQVLGVLFNQRTGDTHRNSKTKQKSFIQNRTKHEYMPVYKFKSSWALSWASSRKKRSGLVGAGVDSLLCLTDRLTLPKLALT